jgi:hypothetical protein
VTTVSIPAISADIVTALSELILKRRPNIVPTSNMVMMKALSIRSSVFKFMISIIFDAYTAV